MASLHRSTRVSPWVIGVYLGLAAIMVAVAAISDSPLEMEGGPLSFLDAFLIFVMAGLLLTLSSQGEWRTPMRSTYLLGTVLALGVGVIQLVGLVDGSTPLVEELDAGNTLCWLIAGGFLAWMLRFSGRVRSAEKFLILGFVLQSFSLVADITDGMPLELPDLFDWLFGPGEEISEVLFLATYCCGFALLVNRSTREALRWGAEDEAARYSIESAMESAMEPAIVIRRAQLVLHRRKGTAMRRALATLSTPFYFAGEFAYHSVRCGARIARLSGKNRLVQALEAMRLGIADGVPAVNYYKFEFFLARNAKLARHYLHRAQFKGPTGVNRLFRRLPGPRSPLNDKFDFADHCQRQGVRTVPILAHGSGGKLLLQTPGGALPQIDLIAKPNNGRGGTGVEPWRWTGKGWRGRNGVELDEPTLLARIANAPVEDGVLLQPLRRNHPAMADLAGGALSTVRMMTCLNEHGQPELTHAVLRMARRKDAAVDNFHAGGMGAPVDLESGRLGRATDMGLRKEGGWTDTHPVSGAAITGRILPLWQEAKALALQAHGACLDRTVIGWDLAILEDGVELIEGNSAPDLDIVQRTHARPVGLDRLGQLMAHHIRDSLR